MKNIKELRQLLINIQKKEYLLMGYSFTKYDIDNIISNNLKKHRDTIFNELNVMKLKTDQPERFLIEKTLKTPIKEYYEKKGFSDSEIKDFMDETKKEYYRETKFKDFDEITAEIKKHFSIRTIKEKKEELLKECPLNFVIKNENWDFRNKPFNYIKSKLNEEHKKELVFNNYQDSYGAIASTLENIKKITMLFNIVLNKNISFDFSAFGYKEPLDNVSELVNKSQDTFKIRLFLNGTLKIKVFNDVEFKKIRTLLINEKFKTYTKEFYVLSDSLKKSEIKELSRMYLSENKVNSFLCLRFNEMELNIWKKNHQNINLIKSSEIEKYNIKSIYNFVKSDKHRIDFIKKRVVDSGLDNYAVDNTINLINIFFKDVE